jgi:FkbM family methyltransferase
LRFDILGQLRAGLGRREPQGVESFSQQGEDMILRSLFQQTKKGFYVDVGAHHPTRYSNTYHFYRRGWSGINVDAMPGSMVAFRQLRPRDVNVEVGVAEEQGRLSYYRFQEPGVNAMSLSEERLADLTRSFGLVDVIEVETRPLAEIFREHVPDGQRIDFMNVDVEGLDLAALRSNDWTTYRPFVIVAEDLDAFTLASVAGSATTAFLASQGYEPCAKCHHSILYARRDRLVGNNFRDV